MTSESSKLIFVYFLLVSWDPFEFKVCINTCKDQDHSENGFHGWCVFKGDNWHGHGLCKNLFFWTCMKHVRLCNDLCWAGWQVGWLARWLSSMANLKRYDFLRHYNYCNKCQALHDDTTHWALPVHTTFSDLCLTSRAQQYRAVLTENSVFLSNEI